ncbi:hypothetical protein ACS5PN_10740 [Roseateles sp. NT4]|uniref:hypothetical protein n=1 Tax=Roseateles sp. NT4 TaxID=3453715 RepID=UPI003EEBFE82
MSTWARLRAQPAGFWLGVGLVAEAPAAVIATLLPATLREPMMAAVFTSPAWATAAIAACLLLYAGTAWAAIRLGLGG